MERRTRSYVVMLTTHTKWDLWCCCDGVQVFWLQEQRKGKVFINCSAYRSFCHSLKVRKCFHSGKALDFSPVIFHDPFLYFELVLVEFELWELQVRAKTQASVFHTDLFTTFLSCVCLPGSSPTQWVPGDYFLASLLKAAVPLMKSAGQAGKYPHLQQHPVGWLWGRHKLWLYIQGALARSSQGLELDPLGTQQEQVLSMWWKISWIFLREALHEVSSWFFSWDCCCQ